jgi:hypothetical protein
VNQGTEGFSLSIPTDSSLYPYIRGATLDYSRIMSTARLADWAYPSQHGTASASNLYLFVHNGPPNEIDPDGRFGWALKTFFTGMGLGHIGIAAYSLDNYFDCMSAQLELTRLAREKLDPEAFQEWQRQNVGKECNELLRDFWSHVGQGALWASGRLLLIRHGYNPLTSNPIGK